MAHFRELVATLPDPETVLESDDIDRLHVLLSEWQVLADLWIADLVLWLPAGEGRFMAVEHCRPGTGSTIHLDDVVGLMASSARAAQLEQAYRTQDIVAPSAIRWAGSYAVQETYVPIVHHGTTIAVLSAEKNPSARPGFGFDVHNWFEELAKILAEMLTTGEYPPDVSPAHIRSGTPRVSDGVVWLDAEGAVKELSPNAHSCFRNLGIHGSLRGKVLAELITDLVLDNTPVDETLPVVVMGRAAWMTEVESATGVATIRALPLVIHNRRLGAVLLCRNVTETRRHERELLTKDATIREIHHRVKNNLQTVSALLRMQARRSNSDEVKEALGQAQRRVATIAHAHEALSHTVDETLNFDQMMETIMRMAASMASTQGEAKINFEGSFGMVDAESASSLAVVLAELVTNAVEHGLEGQGDRGEVTVRVMRHEPRGAHEWSVDSPVGIESISDGQEGEAVENENDSNGDDQSATARVVLEIDVIDNGKGINTTEVVGGLGAQIVRTFLTAELHGSIEWLPGDDGVGTRVHMIARIPNLQSADEA